MHTMICSGARAAGKLLAVPAAILAVSPAFAATTSSTLNVSATVTANCTVSTSPLAFGNVNPLSGADVDGAGGITVTCTNGTGWDASAGIGGGSGASFASRRMTAGANLLNYNLYTDAGRTTVWGDGTGSTALISDTGSGVAQSVTIYGRVPLGQTTVPPGAYADTVSVTVTY
jgi:spore coat protein U-like protein